MTNNFINDDEALEFHRRNNKPGKIAIKASKPLFSQRDLSLAYSPGVAAPCKKIASDQNEIYNYTSKGNFVAVISNGTAVLGLGNLGAAASKPVMEGKAVLFKKFADIDAIDIEIDTENPDEFINAVKYLGKSWGGINLEDIKAPECFIIEDKLQELMDIPVFHDDQHGTAIITAAAFINALDIVKKSISEVKVVVNGAGAASIACSDLLKLIGVKHENLIMCDTEGVIYSSRLKGMNPWKKKHANDVTEARTLSEAMINSDVFIGLSVKGAVNTDMIKSMAKSPIIFAMANPDPEITPEEIRSVRSDAIIATGRSDYNNQVNNVMGFPYIFRGALDVRASRINNEMKIAAVNAIAMLAREPVPEEVVMAYSGKKMHYGPEYIIPVPFDPRLITSVPIAVAKAAIDSGVARKNIADFKQYKNDLEHRLDPASYTMSMIFENISSDLQNIVFADGEEEDVIKAAVILCSNKYVNPILVGRENIIHDIFKDLGLENYYNRIKIANAAKVHDLDKYINIVYDKLKRKGYLYRDCSRLVKRDKNIFAACMVYAGDADGMVTGLTRGYLTSIEEVTKVIGIKENSSMFSYSILLSNEYNLIISDSSIHESPSADELASIAINTAAIAKDFGYAPRVAFMSFSNFGAPKRDKGSKIRHAIEILDNKNIKDFEYEGEMTPTIALNKSLMSKLYPFSRLSDSANILIMPDLHCASISIKLLQELGGGLVIGPILTGLTHSIQVVQLGSSVNQIVNAASFAALNSIKLRKN